MKINAALLFIFVLLSSCVTPVKKKCAQIFIAYKPVCSQ